MKAGTHVWANAGGEDFIGHFVDEGSDKDTVQAPNGDRVQLAHREPADRDAGGKGGTWWKVG